MPRAVQSRLARRGRILALVEGETAPLLKIIFILRIFLDEREQKVGSNSQTRLQAQKGRKVVWKHDLHSTMSIIDANRHRTLVNS